MFISKRKNGYYYLFVKDDLTSKRIMVSCKTKKKSEALKFLNQYDNSLHSKSNNKILLSVFQLQAEVMKYVTDNLRHSTTLIYKRVFRDFLRIIGDKHLRLITVKDIEGYKSKRLEEVSPSTVNIDLTTLKAIFNIAIRFNWLDSNPVNQIKKLKINDKERYSFNSDEIALVLNNIENADLKNIVLFGLKTGCRLNEILNIQISDINLPEGEITIRNKSDFSTKTGKMRIIPITTDLKELLKDIIGIQDNIIEMREGGTYLFNRNGFRYNKDYISKSFKKGLRKIGFPEKFHFHCLRHTFITNLIKAGVNINYVKALAGHSDITTTEHYIHISTKDLRQAIDINSIK